MDFSPRIAILRDTICGFLTVAYNQFNCLGNSTIICFFIPSLVCANRRAQRALRSFEALRSAGVLSLATRYDRYIQSKSKQKGEKEEERKRKEKKDNQESNRRRSNGQALNPKSTGLQRRLSGVRMRVIETLDSARRRVKIACVVCPVTAIEVK